VRTSLIIALLLLTCARSFAQSASTPAEAKTGAFFSWCEPTGWKSTETSMGVELWHPDGVTMTSFAFIRGDMGMSPAQFIQRVIEIGPTKDIRVTSRNVLKDGTEEWTGTFTLEGRQMTGVMACKVIPGAGVILTGHHAPVEVFDRADGTLRRLIAAVRVVSDQAGVLEGRGTGEPASPELPEPRRSEPDYR
jgi:hypothetical protein